MNKYHDLLQRMLASKPDADAELRKSLYERAYHVAQDVLKDQYDEKVIEDELTDLRAAIKAIEDQYRTPAPGPAAAPETGAGDIATQAGGPAAVPPPASAEPGEPAAPLNAPALARQEEPLQEPELRDPAPQEPPLQEPPGQQSLSEPPPAPNLPPEPRPGETDMPPEEMAEPDTAPDPSDYGPVPREAESGDGTSVPGRLGVVLTVAAILGLGTYAYLASPNTASVTSRIAAGQGAPDDLPTGVLSRQKIGAGLWSLGDASAKVQWNLETRAPNAADYALGSNVVTGNALFEAAGLRFQIDIRRVSDKTMKISHAIAVKATGTRPDSRQILKMFMPRVISKEGAASAELNGVVIRTGNGGFMATLSNTGNDLAVNSALLRNAVRMEVPFLVDAGNRISLLVALPANVLQALEAGG